MCGSEFVVVCAQMDDFLSAVVSERGVEEEGAVDMLVGYCADGGRIHGGAEDCREGGGESWWDRVHASFSEEG